MDNLSTQGAVVTPSTPGERPPVIRAEGLWKSYGDVEAVRGLSFEVGAGEVVGLLGPNGAGKTTVIHMLTTLISIDTGRASVGGFDVATQHHQVRRMIGLAGQNAAVDEKLTARENLTLFARLYKLPRVGIAGRVDELIERFRMGEFAERSVGTLSGGQRRRLDVVAALVADPPALFLDEPTTGLDPRSRSEMWEAIEGLRDDGTAIVLTTQYLEEADRLADHIVLIDEGVAVAAGTPGQLKSDLERDVLEIHFETDEALDLAIAMVGETVTDRAGRLLQVPVGNGAGSSLDVLRRLDDAGIAITDFQLRKPTLDDVFMTLTGGEEGA